MTLQLDIGENAQDYSEIAKQEHLSGQTPVWALLRAETAPPLAAQLILCLLCHSCVFPLLQRLRLRFAS